MRKYYFFVSIFIFVFVLISSFPQTVNAENDIIIPEWAMDAQLLENGDLEIIEDITFKFNDHFNGVFREIVLNKTSGISDIQVQELMNNTLKEYHPGDIPEDCTPAVAAYLTNALVYDKYIFATILDLVRKGYLKISKAQNSSEQAEDEYYIISQLKEVDDCLLSHEKFFINMLINKIGNGHSVSTSEIQRFSKDNGSKFSNLFSEWRRKIKEDIVSKGYYDKSKTEYGVICILSFVVLFIVSISALVKGILYGIAGIIISSVLFIYGLVLLNRLTDYGHSQYKKWKKFKKYI